MDDNLLYFDYLTTTPLDDRVFEVMKPYWTSVQPAQAVIEDSREKVASILHCQPSEVVFTATGTESNSMAIQGVARAMRDAGRGSHLIISQADHLSVLRSAELLEKEGFTVTRLPVDVYGRVNESDVEEALQDDTVLVSLFYASSEVGTVNPIGEVGELLQERDIFFHVDALHAPGLLCVEVDALHADLMSLSAHKFYGPKGAGMLYIREGVPFQPIILGDGQENDRRSGTEAVPLIVGMAEALHLAEAEREEMVRRLIPMRDNLMRRLLLMLPDAYLIGHPIKRLPGHTSFAVREIDSQAFYTFLNERGVLASPRLILDDEAWQQASYVLKAMQVGDDRIMGQIRFSIGRFTSLEAIDNLLEQVARAVEAQWVTT